MADTSSSNTSTNLHGLFGAIIVEPVGATWTDPETGLHDMTMPINYRAEPARNRIPEGTGGVGEEAREPTDLEKANFVEDYAPGELYSKTFKPGAPIRVFDIVAI